MHVPNILTIAGSDSGGGAGIQADLKTIMAMGCYGMSAITALTAQNGLGVQGILASSGAFMTLQLETIFAGFEVHAAKCGMLFNAEIINAVADALQGKTFPDAGPYSCPVLRPRSLGHAHALFVLAYFPSPA